MNKWISVLLIVFVFALWGFKAASNTDRIQCDPNKPKPSAVAANPPGPDDRIAAKVNMTRDMRFDPDRVTIQSGQTVVWKNTSSVIHTITTDPAKVRDKDDVSRPDGAATFDSGAIEPGQTYAHTFTFPGTYRYVCIPHEAMGMKGQVTVEPASN